MTICNTYLDVYAYVKLPPPRRSQITFVCGILSMCFTCKGGFLGGSIHIYIYMNIHICIFRFYKYSYGYYYYYNNYHQCQHP